MLSKTAKLTSKNQLTLPKSVVESLGWPTHFRVQVVKGALVLWPGRVMTGAEFVAERVQGEETRARKRGGASEGGTPAARE
jgi:hypothetical protein